MAVGHRKSVLTLRQLGSTADTVHALVSGDFGVISHILTWARTSDPEVASACFVTTVSGGTRFVEQAVFSFVSALKVVRMKNR